MTTCLICHVPRSYSYQDASGASTYEALAPIRICDLTMKGDSSVQLAESVRRRLDINDVTRPRIVVLMVDVNVVFGGASVGSMNNVNACVIVGDAVQVGRGFARVRTFRMGPEAYGRCL